MSYVRIAVGNVYSCIIGELPPAVSFTLSTYLSFQHKDAHFQLSYQKQKMEKAGKKVDWDGRTYCYWQDHNQSFYTGMLSVVKDLLTKSGVEFKVEDRRTRITLNLPNLTYTAPPEHEPRPYQEAAIQMMLRAQRGILQAGTGSGKTAMVTDLISRIKTGPFLFLVLSQDLLEQAHEFMSSTLNMPIGRICAGECDIQNINVMMVQTAVRALNFENKDFDIKEYVFDEDDQWEDLELDKPSALKVQELIKAAGGIYFDEVHHVASRTCKEVITAAKSAYWRYGGSATPFREDGAEMMIQAMFGKKLVDISLSYLIREKYLLKPYIFIVDMGDEDLGDWKSWQEIYKHYIVHNQSLNENVAKLIHMFEERGLTSLTLVQQYPHGDNIKQFYPDLHFIKGNQSRKKRKRAIDALRNGEMKSAIATTLADEGLDVRRLNAAVVAGGGKSITRVYQRVGRTLRPFGNQDRAVVVFFHHRCRFLDKHGKRIKNILKQEEEFIIKRTTPAKMFKDIASVLDKPLLLDFGQ